MNDSTVTCFSFFSLASVIHLVIQTLVCYKHQFIYIYPPNPDSGGKIWLNFIRILMSCMLIGEFTSTLILSHFCSRLSPTHTKSPLPAVVGLMSLKKGFIAVPLMIPLIIVTILFNMYLREEHFRVAEFLPSREGMKVDVKHGPDFDAPSFTKDAYLQEELRDKEKLPEDLTDEQREGILSIMNENNNVADEYTHLTDQL
jgi:hypothetical protein